MAQSVCVIVSAVDRERLEAIVANLRLATRPVA